MSLELRGLTDTNMKAAGVDALAEEFLQRVLQRVKLDHRQGTAGLPRQLAETYDSRAGSRLPL